MYSGMRLSVMYAVRKATVFTIPLSIKRYICAASSITGVTRMRHHYDGHRKSFSMFNKSTFAMAAAAVVGSSVFTTCTGVVHADAVTHEDDGVIIDANGISHPSILGLSEESPDTMVYLGSGTRTKYYLASVYSVAIYMDVIGALKKLEEGKGFKSLLNRTDIDRAIRIKLQRNINAEEFTKAMRAALEPRLKEQGVEDLTVLDTFVQSFPKSTLYWDGELIITMSADGLMNVCIDMTMSKITPFTLVKNHHNKEARTAPYTTFSIQSSELCAALYDVYVGDEPIVNDVKKNVVHGLIAHVQSIAETK